MRVELPLILDTMSLSFAFSVRLITCAVLIFSRSYMAKELHFLRFHLLVMLFVMSIFLLVLSPNMVSVLLG